MNVCSVYMRTCTQSQEMHAQFCRNRASLGIFQNVIAQECQCEIRVVHKRPRIFPLNHRERLALADPGLQHSYTAIISVREAHQKDPCFATNFSKPGKTIRKGRLFVVIRINSKFVQFVVEELIFTRGTVCTHRQQRDS